MDPDDLLFNQLAEVVWAGFFDQTPNDEIELRDAYTGKKLGLTKKQYKRYVLALGSKDSAVIMQACEEVKQRKNQFHDTVEYDTNYEP